MTQATSAANGNLPIRAAVTTSPDYPFKHYDAEIKLDQNELPVDFPAHLKTLALSRMLEQPWNRYPDLNAERLREAISAYENWPAAGVIVTTGSNVLITLLTQLAGIDKRVVTVAPNFPLYALSARLLESDLTEVPLQDDLSLNIPELIAALHSNAGTDSAKTGVFYIPQPHSPTGTLAEEHEIDLLLKESSGWLTVIDEAYCQFSRTDSKKLAAAYPHAIILRTFSKAWGLAGLRLGYALTSPEIARQLQKLVPPFGVSMMQTVVAQVALEHADDLNQRVNVVIEERERVTAQLATLRTWKVFPSSTNFLLIRTPDAARAFEQLLEHGILARRQDSLPGLQGCIRVTIGTPAENDAFLEAAGLIDG